MGEWLDRAESGGRWTPLHCSRVSTVTACKRRVIRFIHSFIYFDSGGMAHKNNRQITIDNTRKYRKTDGHIVDK